MHPKLLITKNLNFRRPMFFLQYIMYSKNAGKKAQTCGLLQHAANPMIQSAI